MKANGGFTLIEIVISLAIISISFVMLISVLDKSIVSTAYSMEMTSAVMLAEEKISLVSGKKFLKPGVSEWKEDERYPRYRFRTTIMKTRFIGARKVAVDVELNQRHMITLTNYVILK